MDKGQTPGQVSINQLGVSGHTVDVEGHSKMPDSDKVHCTPTVDTSDSQHALVLAQQLPPLPRFSGEGPSTTRPRSNDPIHRLGSLLTGRGIPGQIPQM